jgi:hypothetical protein
LKEGTFYYCPRLREIDRLEPKQHSRKNHMLAYGSPNCWVEKDCL